MRTEARPLIVCGFCGAAEGKDGDGTGLCACGERRRITWVKGYIYFRDGVEVERSEYDPATRKVQYTEGEHA